MATVVVGAGVTGLTVADRLLDAGRDVVLVEKEDRVGGLCRSFRYGDFTFDIGPHRLFSSNPAVHAYFLSVLGSAYTEISRDSMVRLKGRYLGWPLSVVSVLRLPPRYTLRCFRDLLSTNHRPRSQTGNLEEFIVSRYGPTIYEIFWKGYTEKFLGIPCREVDAVWGKISVGRSVVDRRTEPSGLFDLLKNALLPRKQRVSFLYPDGGMGAFPDRCAARIRARAGRVLVSRQIERIEHNGGRVTRVHTGRDTFEIDDLVWTGSLLDACGLLGLPLPALRYLSTVLYNLELDRDLPGRWQWIYFSDPRIIFSRVSRPSRFSPATAPAGRTGLCVEVSSGTDPRAWDDPGALRERVLADLLAVGLVGSRDAVRACHIERIEATYPLYRTGFAEHVARIRERLAPFRNLHLAGRQARFQHDNIDEALDDALGVVRSLTGS